MNEFSRSPEIEEAITTIRELPQGTILNDTPESMNKIAQNSETLYGIKGSPEEQQIRKLNAEKQEAAKLLRMEVMLCNSKFIHDALRIIQEQPNITQEHLVESLSAENKITHPEVAERYVEELFNNVRTVSKVVEALSANGSALMLGVSNDRIHFVGDVITTDINGDIRRYKDKMRGVLLPGYPLAVVISANDKLYEYLHNDVASNGMTVGFYLERNETGFHIDTYSETTYFPIIVIRGSQPQSVDIHEKGHNENALLKAALLNEKDIGKHLCVWGGIRAIEYDKVSALKDKNRTLEDPELQSAMKYALSYAFTSAKDELLADYNASRDNGELPMETRLLKLEDLPVYDFFASHLYMDKTSQTYQLLKSEYISTLKENARVAIQLIQTYSINGWTSRVDLMAGVLQQVPLENWKKFLDTNLFNLEAAALEKCNSDMAVIEYYIKGLQLGFVDTNGMPPDDTIVDYYVPKIDKDRIKEIETKLNSLDDKVMEVASLENDTVPMVHHLEEVARQLDDLFTLTAKYYEQSDAPQYRLAFERLINQFPENVKKNRANALKMDLAGHTERTFYGVLTEFQKRHRYELQR